jgi:hypothetical protein
MSAPTFRRRPEFVRGRTGEQRVARWLQERGFCIIPSYDYSGADGDKPPRLQGLTEGHPVPDLDVARAGSRRWVEVKTKRSAVEYRRTGEWRHGVNLRHLESYRKVQQETGTEVWIAIYEESTGDLLAQTLSGLGEPETGTDRGTRMAYWPRDKFQYLTTFRDDDATGGEAA